MQLDSAIYEVLETKDKKGNVVGSGLTVNSKVFKVGQKFTAVQWAWGEDALKEAVKNGRCKKISEGKKEDKKAKKEDDK